MQLDIMVDTAEWHTNAARAVLKCLFLSVVSETLWSKCAGEWKDLSTYTSFF